MYKSELMRLASGQKERLLIALSSLVLLVASCNYLYGDLIRRYGLNHGVAKWVVTALTSGGIYIVSVLYPFLAPALFTLNGLIATIGTAYAIGW